MGTVAEKLEYLTETKQLIADAVNAKGGDITPATPFREYADKINELPAGVVDKKKFGVSIDDFFGDVDENGKYVIPNMPLDLDFTGLKTGLPERIFYNETSRQSGGIKRFYAPDLEELSEYCLSFAVGSDFDFFCPKVKKVNSNACYYLTGSNRLNYGRVFFGGLEVIGEDYYANSCFSSAFTYVRNLELIQRVFPKLRLVYGTTMFDNFLYYDVSVDESKRIIPSCMFANVEEFYGAYGTTDITSQYSAMFGQLNAKVFLPKCVKVPTYMFRPFTDTSTTKYEKELHFAIKNRAAIEACAGYDNNFGGTGVFFDLVSAITVNDVVYQRSEEDSITETFEKFYTAWKSDNGDIVYTYDGNYTVEPAVGTEVFSDGGQTVVGTVSAIE